MSIFDTDIIESKTIDYKGKSYTVYEMTAHDRVYKIPILENDKDVEKRKQNIYQWSQAIIMLALKPGYPENSDEEIREALNKIPEALAEKLFVAAAEINQIPLASDKDKGKKK